MNTRTLLLLITSVVVGTRLCAQNPNVGTAGAQFLQIPVGAREAAMGGAVIANVRDASAMFWNPAGITHVGTHSLFFAYTSWWATISISNAAYALSIPEVGTIGIFGTILSMDPMDVTTEMEPEGNGQTFDARDLMLGIGYARKLTEDFSVGLSVKYVRQEIWKEASSGIAFDVGTQFRLGWKDLTLAMSMANFGGDMRFEGEDLRVNVDQSSGVSNNRLSPANLATDDYPLPLHFQVGLSLTAVEMENFSWLVAVDVTHPNDNKERVNLGTEITLVEYLQLRGGYRIAYDIESATFGAGLRVPLGDARLRFDYAYALYDLLPDIHRISVGLDF
jgi:hypothetical protein